jgi:hypothetical protein
MVVASFSAFSNCRIIAVNNNRKPFQPHTIYGHSKEKVRLLRPCLVLSVSWVGWRPTSYQPQSPDPSYLAVAPSFPWPFSFVQALSVTF